jgi:hypothetical protein
MKKFQPISKSLDRTPLLVFTSSFDAKPSKSQYTDIRVMETKTGNIVFERDEINQGEFSFTARSGGDYSFCFFNRNSPTYDYSEPIYRRVKFRLLTGAETTNYEQVARKEHLKPMELNLRMMEDNVKSILMEYSYFKEREVEMRGTTDTVSFRMIWLSILSFFIIVASAVLQLFYLQNYFRKKKLI